MLDRKRGGRKPKWAKTVLAARVGTLNDFRALYSGHTHLFAAGRDQAETVHELFDRQLSNLCKLDYGTNAASVL